MGANIANTSPWISPISKHVNGVSFRGFPKTFITAGDLEMLKDQITVLKEKMERDIGEDNVEYYLAPLAVHDFIMLGGTSQRGRMGSKRSPLGWLRYDRLFASFYIVIVFLLSFIPREGAVKASDSKYLGCVEFRGPRTHSGMHYHRVPHFSSACFPCKASSDKRTRRFGGDG
jgi:hypothetical protein